MFKVVDSDEPAVARSTNVRMGNNNAANFTYSAYSASQSKSTDRYSQNKNSSVRKHEFQPEYQKEESVIYFLIFKAR